MRRHWVQWALPLALIAATIELIVWLVPDREPPSAPATPRQVTSSPPPTEDELLRASLKRHDRRSVDQLRNACKWWSPPPAGRLREEFRRVKKDWRPNAEYEILERDYAFKTDATRLQPEKYRKVTSLPDDVLWFSWLAADRLAYMTVKGIFTKGLDSEETPVAQFAIPVNAVCVLSPDKRRVAINFGSVIVAISLPDGTIRQYLPKAHPSF